MNIRTVMMEDIVIGRVWTMKVMLGMFIVMQLCVLSSGMEKGDEGVCLDNPVTQMETTYKKYPAKYRCPGGFSMCNPTETKAQNFPRGMKCCKKRVAVTKMMPICCSGWKHVAAGDFCQPMCTNGCNNGRCVKPDECECDAPRILVNKNSCEIPICEGGCFNGTCIANDTCECNPPYKLYNETHCVDECNSGYINDPITLNCIPKCDKPCLNGTCTGPNTCTCLNGYKVLDNFTCVPDCIPACGDNAECVAPNKCACIDGYRLDEGSSICSPVCDSCEHGSCISPNHCECNEGYTMKDGQCVPVCDRTCKNGVCVAPNVCECDDGYEINREDKFDCLPICEPNCINASCASPNMCACHIGYETTGNNWICTPTCNDCKNGECVAPNECECHDGYKKIDGTCQPVCDQPCSNGVCSEPNVCTCNVGYILNSVDKFSCKPVCDQECINAVCAFPNTCSCLTGYEPTDDNHICKPKCTSCQHGECTAPDICMCHAGYEKTDGKCTPVCTRACINANCTAPNKCTCNDGYEIYDSNSSICHKPCMNLCDHGICSLHGICRCDRGYEMFNNTCTPITPIDCTTCEYNCTAGDCWCADDTPCVVSAAKAEVSTETTSLAGLELTWTLGGAVLLLLLILVVVVMYRIYIKRKKAEFKEVDDMRTDRYGSVVYTVPDTLMQRNEFDDNDVNDNENDDTDHDDSDVKKTNQLLKPEFNDNDQKL